MTIKLNNYWIYIIYIPPVYSPFSDGVGLEGKFEMCYFC